MSSLGLQTYRRVGRVSESGAAYSSDAQPADVPKRLPADIRDVVALLRDNAASLSDVMAEQVREVILNLADELRGWRDGGPEPDWPGYRGWINEICADDGMPHLFDLSDVP
jgi:hypothetical protein